MEQSVLTHKPKLKKVKNKRNIWSRAKTEQSEFRKREREREKLGETGKATVLLLPFFA